MKRSFAIITSGSRGDVQPFIALALGLQAAGHAVRLATHEEFRSWIIGNGLIFAPIAGDLKALLGSAAAQNFLEPRNPVSFIQGAKKLNIEVKDMLSQQMRDGLLAASGMDALICSTSAPLSVFVAEKLAIPSIYVSLAPIARTRDFPSVVFAPRMFSPAINKFSHFVFESIVECLLRRHSRTIRREHGMHPLPYGKLFSNLYAKDALLLNAFSAKIIQRPSDWPPEHVLTGFWTIPTSSEYGPDPTLVDFLNAGEAPFYMGFGSMVDKSPTELTDLAVAAACKAGKRLIISRGWANLASSVLPSFVFAVSDVPHEWLFPKLSGIVHHGGAGTTAAALRAGIPSTIVPFGVDQPFWGHRVAAAGVGCAPIPRKQLSSANLAHAFMQMSTDSAMKEKAALLGKELQSENGVLSAVSSIESYIEQAINDATRASLPLR